MELLDQKKSTARVLIVDDVQDNILVLGLILRHLNIEFDIAHDGQEAWLKHQMNSYALIFSDIYMPGKNGYELASAIRQSERSRPQQPKCILVAMSAIDSEVTNKESFINGFDHHIDKPIPKSFLVQILTHYGIIADAPSNTAA